MNQEDNLADALQRFLSAEDPPQMLALVAEEDALRSEAALAELAAMIEAEGESGRREFLAERRELLAALQQMSGALADLPEAERQFLAFMAIPSSLGMAAQVTGSDDATLDALEATATAKLAEAGEEEAAGIQARLDDLRGLRAGGRDAAQPRLDAAQAAADRFGDRLIAWIQTPDWDASQQYLAEHAADLLSDDGEAALELLQLANPGNEQIPMHRQLLQFAREQGIDAAYAQLRRELAAEEGLGELGELGELTEAARALAENPLLQAVVEFVQAMDDEQARQAFDERRSLLLTADARDLLEQFLEVARQQGDARAAERIAARLALVQEARLARHAPAVAASQGQLASLGGETSNAPQTLASSVEGVKYLVVNAQNCTVGDHGITINNFGVVPLQWRKPEEFQRTLTDKAVGRREELAGLRRALQNGSAALVGKGIERGTSGALHGLPGVGKSTLAALYAEAYAYEYPGGVLWLQLTPDMTTAESVGPELSRVAAYAYSMDVQAYRLLLAAQQIPGDPTAALRAAQFAPEIVRGLLNGHGRLLVVADNAWDRAVLAPIRAALPIDAHLLVTTREERVAVAMGRRMELDVLSEEDALSLIEQTLPELPVALARQLAQAVGRHPLALEVAVGDLAAHGPREWAGLVAQIEAGIVQGLSLDGAPLADDAARERRLDIVLRYSYDALGRAPHGAALQERLRALGCLAYEADFATDAAAAQWDEDSTAANEHLNIFAARSLLRRKGGGRWSQHGILRGFALGLQSAAERDRWPERHAQHYLAAMRAADEAQRYYVMAPDLPNLRHAFAWARGESLPMAQSLLGACADLLRSQNLGYEYLIWADQVLKQAQRSGGPRELGQAWLSRGNALQAAATLVVGEDRGARLRQALQAYDEALALLRDVPLDYAQTQNNRANLLSDLASLPGEDRGARLRQALQAAADAVRLFEVYQHVQYLAIARSVLAGVVVEMRPDLFVACWQELYPNTEPPRLTPQELVSALAAQEKIDSNEACGQRIQIDPQFKQRIDELIAFALAQTPTPDDVAADPLSAALSALLRIDSDQALVQTLHDHPILAEAEALLALAEMLNEALKQQQGEAVARWVLFLGLLLEPYNHAHSEQINLEAHMAVIDLCQQLIPLAEQIDDGLASGLRQQGGWACNTLGNHFANDGEHQDLAQAIAAYTRGIAFDPANAMMLRNRAGVHIDRRDLAAARADIDAAAALQPDAPRLADLHAALDQAGAP